MRGRRFVVIERCCRCELVYRECCSGGRLPCRPGIAPKVSYLRMASLANPGRAAARPVARVLMMRDHSLEMWCSVETIAFILVGMAGRRLAGSGLMAPTGTPRLRQCLGELQRWNGYWLVGLGFGLLLFRVYSFPRPRSGSQKSTRD